MSNLTYNQWENGLVLRYPLPGLNTGGEMSYVNLYAGFTELMFPPEQYYYGL